MGNKMIEDIIGDYFGPTEEDVPAQLPSAFAVVDTIVRNVDAKTMLASILFDDLADGLYEVHRSYSPVARWLQVMGQDDAVECFFASLRSRGYVPVHLENDKESARLMVYFKPLLINLNVSCSGSIYSVISYPDRILAAYDPIQKTAPVQRIDDSILRLMLYSYFQCMYRFAGSMK